MDVKTLQKKILKANQAYRSGDAIISDKEYDALVDKLDDLTNGKDEILTRIGFEPEDDVRKTKLPIPMYSMNKVKSADEIHRWARLNDIPLDVQLVITPKYDGLSLLVDENEKEAYTRGNGQVGQRSDQHFAVLSKNKQPVIKEVPGFTFGEVIMKISLFKDKYAHEFKNSRNLGAGMMNSKEPKDILTDFTYIRFGIMAIDKSEKDKTWQIDFLNKYINDIKLPYKIINFENITDEFLQEIFTEFSQDFEIDGLIIELDSARLRKQMGREKNGNPSYARAWKGYRPAEKISTIQGISWQVSKHGLLKPVAHIEPVDLDGVSVSNVTLINAKYVKESGAGIGSEIIVIRSGQVIPKIIKVLKKGKTALPKKCPSCNDKVQFNENKVELVCANKDCPERQVQQLLAFFSIIGVENMAIGIIQQFYDEGYDTVEKILKMSKEEMLALEHFQEKKATLIFDGIQDKIKEIPLEVAMHASCVFAGLAEKKLMLLNQFNTAKKKPSLEQVAEIAGFSDISASEFINNYDKFWAFIKPLPITIQKVRKNITVSTLSDLAIVFSGVRRKDLEQQIIENGGRVLSAVSSNTSHLVMKTTGTGSSKEKKAEKLDVDILTIEDFEKLLSQRLS